MKERAREVASQDAPEAVAKEGYKLTPVMQQYLEIKSAHEDAVLFFRMGDFYEMFFEDAEKASSILDIALTSRNRNDDSPIPMCGVPYHSAKPYIGRLLDAGVKVAVCEQLELPRRGIARREVTRVITPGTLIDEDALAPEQSNYLAAVCEQGGSWGLAWTDFSTGEIRVTETAGVESLEDELAGVAPSELLVEPGIADGSVARLAAVVPGCAISRTRAGNDDHDLRAHEELPQVCRHALSQLAGYIAETHAGDTAHLREPVYYEADGFLKIDRATQRNLELVEATTGGRKGSLLSVVDRAVTPMGKRLVRQWLLRPLAEVHAIGERLDAVEHLHEHFDLRQDFRAIVREVGDLERLAGRVGSGTAGPRDLTRLATAVDAVERLRARLGAGSGLPRLLAGAAQGLDGVPAVRELIGRALVDAPPAALGRGEVIRPRYHEEVDRLRAVSKDGKGWMAAFETAERKRTGIGHLKIGYNKVFGYYLEASRAVHDRVPDDYERKQTLTNSERYVTAELKRRESEVLGAEERLATLETHLFAELLEAVAAYLPALSRSAASLAVLDALAGLAETAHQSAYTRPEVTADGSLEIVESRHPVVEAALGTGFIPNDCRLGPDLQMVAVITGPNMAGKSTYLRQVALITLLAHCGSFVPATSAKVPIVDRVFTRIGASDDLSRGQSTFMVEMTETANILHHMTDRSLVVLDEIGRGTSTFDGISIAWAVAEAMVAAGVKTLFATHYHELAGLAAEHELVANFSVAVRRYRGEVIFLYRVVEGATSGSYGIEVARLAGLPAGVIDSARRMLAKFESAPGPVEAVGEVQPSLFETRAAAGPADSVADRERERLIERLGAIDPDTLRPIEALNLLDELVRALRKGQ